MKLVVEITEEEYERLVYQDIYKLREYISKATPLEEVLEEIKAEIEQNTQRYSLSRASGGMGQDDWWDYLIKSDKVYDIIDNHISGKDATKCD